jgi:HK97 family phage portal protein
VLSEEQFERLKRELTETSQGAAQCRPAAAAGRRARLEGDVAVAARHGLRRSQAAAAREIALAFGVPPMLLGLPGDNTFANYQEANRAFWRQTVLPLASRVAASLAQWLAPQAGEGIRIEIDTDRIDALSADRAAAWQRLAEATFLTLNEKREAAGYAPVEGGDVVG